MSESKTSVVGAPILGPWKTSLTGGFGTLVVFAGFYLRNASLVLGVLETVGSLGLTLFAVSLSVMVAAGAAWARFSEPRTPHAAFMAGLGLPALVFALGIPVPERAGPVPAGPATARGSLFALQPAPSSRILEGVYLVLNPPGALAASERRRHREERAVGEARQRGLEADLQAAEERVQLLEREIETLIRVDPDTDEIPVLRRQLRDCERRLDVLDGKERHCQEARDESLRRAAAESIRRRQAEQELAQVRDELGRCQAELRRDDPAMSELRERLARLERENDEISGELSTCREERLRLQEELRNLMRTHEAALETCRRELEAGRSQRERPATVPEDQVLTGTWVVDGQEVVVLIVQQGHQFNSCMLLPRGGCQRASGRVSGDALRWSAEAGQMRQATITARDEQGRATRIRFETSLTHGLSQELRRVGP
ncbi:MAG: hypothetical protein AAF533_27485 [Acidobacteriota bacterium]